MGCHGRAFGDTVKFIMACFKSSVEMCVKLHKGCLGKHHRQGKQNGLEITKWIGEGKYGKIQGQGHKRDKFCVSRCHLAEPCP